jgi:type II pantothenate kinase
VALPVTVDTAGAKILDGDGLSGPDQKDSRDIWLPNWVETVSHIAVDVSAFL